MSKGDRCGVCGKDAVQRYVELTAKGRPVAVRFRCATHKVRPSKTRRAFDVTTTNEKGK